MNFAITSGVAPGFVESARRGPSMVTTSVPCRSRAISSPLRRGTTLSPDAAEDARVTEPTRRLVVPGAGLRLPAFPVQISPLPDTPR
jgi:hypothetical protein